MTSAEHGLKVIIADGECQLARQRRVRAEDAGKLKRGERVVRTKFGVDDEICTGDHSCIRLSGCPSLTVKPTPDPLRTDPVATVIECCVGCGLCGEVAHAAVLCPSFYRAEIMRNANGWDRTLFTRPPHRDRLVRRPRAPEGTGDGMSTAPRPVTLLIAALGGEGGGVLTDWIVAAAADLGLPAQSTSIPGVAQRTGATTYYIEIFPTPWQRARRQASGARARARRRRRRHGGGERIAGSRPRIANGFVTPDRTLADLLDQPLLCDGREDGDGRRPLRRRAPARGRRAELAERASCSTWKRSPRKPARSSMR